MNKTSKFLKVNNDIIVTKSDKCNKTVILNLQDYLDKSFELLNNKEIYIKIRSDPTSTIEKKSNDYIKYLENKQILTSKESKLYKTYNSISPLFYGLPKIHKPDTPLRPIISCIYLLAA